MSVDGKNSNKTWWVKVDNEMKVAGAAGNCQRQLKHMLDTGG